jgi:excinuclease ABC subunit B
VEASVVRESGGNYQTVELLRELEAEMIEAAENLQFEKAAILRDQITELKNEGKPEGHGAPPMKRQVKYDRKLKVNVVKRSRPAKAR